MKKVSSTKKKVISTSLAVSMLVSSAGVSQCFADGGSKSLPENTQVNEGPTLPSLNNVNVSDGKEITQGNKGPTLPSLNNVNVSDWQKNNQGKEVPLFPNLDKALENIEKKNSKKTKINNFAKTAAKVVAVAALAGAAAYVGYKYAGYKYKDKLADIAKKPVNYAASHVKTDWGNTNLVAKTAKASIENEAKDTLAATKNIGANIGTGAENVLLLPEKQVGVLANNMKMEDKGVFYLIKGIYHHKKAALKCYVGTKIAIDTYTIINKVADTTSKIKKSVKELASTTKSIVMLPVKTVSVLKSGATKSFKAIKAIKYVSGIPYEAYIKAKNKRFGNKCNVGMVDQKDSNSIRV